MKISYWLSSDDVSKVTKGTNEGLFNYTEVGFLKKKKKQSKNHLWVSLGCQLTVRVIYHFKASLETEIIGRFFPWDQISWCRFKSVKKQNTCDSKSLTNPAVTTDSKCFTFARCAHTHCYKLIKGNKCMKSHTHTYTLAPIATVPYSGSNSRLWD